MNGKEKEENCKERTPIPFDRYWNKTERVNIDSGNSITPENVLAFINIKWKVCMARVRLIKGKKVPPQRENIIQTTHQPTH